MFQIDRNTVVHVGYLPDNITPEDLIVMFERYGDIVDSKVHRRNPDTACPDFLDDNNWEKIKMQKFGFVQFKDADDAAKAINSKIITKTKLS